MPSLSKLPSDLRRSKFIKALKRLGFVVDKKGGNGSHFKATWPATQKCITIPSKLSKQVLLYVLKEIETHSSVSWEDIDKEL